MYVLHRCRIRGSDDHKEQQNEFHLDFEKVKLTLATGLDYANATRLSTGFNLIFNVIHNLLCDDEITFFAFFLGLDEKAW